MSSASTTDQVPSGAALTPGTQKLIPSAPSWYRDTKILTAGILKIGAMVPSGGGKMRPEKLDHFRYCSSSLTKDGVYPDHPDFKEENGAKLNSIPVQFYTDDPDLNVEYGWQLMKGGATVCRGLGNGDMNPERRDGMDPSKPFVPFAQECGEACPFARNGSCKRVSVARLIVPGRNGKGQLHTPLNSVWAFRSHGDNTAQLLRNAMRDFKSLTGGILAGLPLQLSMQRETRRGYGAFWSVGLTFDGLPSDFDEACMKEWQRRDRFAAFQAARAVKTKSMEDLLREQGRTIGFEDARESVALNAEFSPATLHGAAVAEEIAAEAPAVRVEVAEQPDAEAQGQDEAGLAAGEPAVEPLQMPGRADGDKDRTPPQAQYIRNLAGGLGVAKEKVEGVLMGKGLGQEKPMSLDQARALITGLKESPASAKAFFEVLEVA